jgi:lipoate---protein ligase
VARASVLCGEWPSASDRGLRVAGCCRVTSEAIVIGSTQREPQVDAEESRKEGIEIVRRPAGGGAVLVRPARQVWIDFWVPRTDELWDDDVTRSTYWVGETWARALASLGVRGAAVHRGGSVHGTWSGLVCFAGLGPGEVTAASRKVVGIAQRRGRHGARFLTVCHTRWDAHALARLLGLLVADSQRRETALSELTDSAVGLDALSLSTGDESEESLILSVEEAVARSLP